MKKIAALVLALALMFVPASFAAETKWNGRSVDIAKRTIGTESAVITSGAGLFYGIIVRTDGTNAVTLNVYDSGSASGTRLTPSSIVIDGVFYQSGWALNLDPPITYTTGIYVNISVAGGGTVSYEVLYYTFP